MTYRVERVPLAALSPGMTFIGPGGAPVVVTPEMLDHLGPPGVEVDALIPDEDPLAMQRAIVTLLQAFPQSEILEVTP